MRTVLWSCGKQESTSSDPKGQWQAPVFKHNQKLSVLTWNVPNLKIWANQIKYGCGFLLSIGYLPVCSLRPKGKSPRCGHRLQFQMHLPPSLRTSYPPTIHRTTSLLLLIQTAYRHHLHGYPCHDSPAPIHLCPRLISVQASKGSFKKSPSWGTGL